MANWALGTSPTVTTGLNISSIRVFDQIRDPEIPITLHPPFNYYFFKIVNSFFTGLKIIQCVSKVSVSNLQMKSTN